jgi:hypothetical protein
MIGTIYRGRINYAATFDVAMPSDVDGADAVTARMMVTRPSVGGAPGVGIEWTVTVEGPTTLTVPVRHVTDGVSNAVDGEHKGAITIYNALGAAIYTTPIFRLQVAANDVATPP